MSKNKMKVAALIVLCGSVFQFGGCFGNGNGLLGGLVRGVPGAVVTEFLIDNTGVFDLFPG